MSARRYDVRLTRPRGGILWTIALLVFVVAGIAAVSEPLAVALVAAGAAAWIGRVFVRAWARHR